MTAKTTKTAKTDDSMTTKVSEGAREMVKRTTATAKERTEGMYESSKKYNADLESLLVRAAKGYVDILGNVADAAYKNVNHTIATAEKIAEAKSISEASQIQMDYVREQYNTNMENARSAFDYVRETVTENTETLRDTAAKVWSASTDEKKAA